MQDVIEKQKVNNYQEKIVGFREDTQTKNRYLKLLVDGLPTYVRIGVQNSIDYTTLIRLFRDIGFYNNWGKIEPVVEYPDIRDLQVSDEYPTEFNIEEKRISEIDEFLCEVDFLSLYTSDLTSNKLSNTSITVTPSCMKITGDLYQKTLTWNVDIRSAHNKSLNREMLEKSDLYVLHKSDFPRETECISADSTNEWLLLPDKPESMRPRQLSRRSIYVISLIYIIFTTICYFVLGFNFPVLIY